MAVKRGLEREGPLPSRNGSALPSVRTVRFSQIRDSIDAATAPVHRAGVKSA